MIQLDKFNQFILKHNNSLFESSFLGAKTSNGVYLNCNNGLASGAGLTPEQMIGKKDSDLCWYMLKEYQENDKRCIQDNKAIIIQENNIDIHNNHKQLITVKMPLINNYHRIIGVSVFAIIIDSLTTNELIKSLNYYTNYFEKTTINLNGFFIRLTEREIECAYFVCLGLSSREIASHLSVSHRTIEDYIGNIKIKLCVNKKSELIVHLLNSGLVDILKLRQLANTIKHKLHDDKNKNINLMK